MKPSASKCHLSEEDRAKFAMLVACKQELLRCDKGGCSLLDGHKGPCAGSCLIGMDVPGTCCSRKTQGLVRFTLEGWDGLKHLTCY